MKKQWKNWTNNFTKKNKSDLRLLMRKQYQKITFCPPVPKRGKLEKLLIFFKKFFKRK